MIGWTALTAVALGCGQLRVNLDVATRGRPVSLTVGAGELSIGPGTPGRLRVTGTARYALTRSTVRRQSGPAGVSISSRCRQLTGPCSFAYAVAVPPRGIAAVEDSAGDMTASGLTGVTFRAGSGNIRVSSLSGEIRISDGSGDVSGSSLAATKLTISAGSGNVTLTGVASPDVTVSSQSGDTTLTFTRVPARVQVSADSGNVTLVLPPGAAAYRVTARSSDSIPVVRVPTNSSSPHVITVTDQSGDITITR